MAAKKAMLQRRRFLKIYSLIKKFCGTWQNFYFYRILNNENFKMQFEQMIFGTRLILQYNIIKLYLFINYRKTRLLKFGQISVKW